MKIPVEIPVTGTGSHIPMIACLQGMEQVWSDRPELPDPSPLLDIILTHNSWNDG